MVEQRIILANGVIIEPARIDDVPKTVALHASLYIPTYRDVTPEFTEEVLREHIENPETAKRIGGRHRELITSPDRGIIFVARAGDEIVGYGAADIDDEGKHWNSGLFVSRQGEGIGRALTRARVLWHGENDIYLKVAPQTSAVGFQRRMGFRPTGNHTYSKHEDGQKLPLDEMKLSFRNQRFTLAVKNYKN